MIMKLTAKTHAILDYIVVIFLLMSPSLFHLPATTAIFTYVLGVVHLSLTALTDFPLGVFKVIPFKVHGAIELLVSGSLVAAAFILAQIDGTIAKTFYLSFAAVVFLTWLISDYKR